MFVKHLQEFLGKFTMGHTNYKGNAISNAKIYVEKDGYLEEIKRMEVHENSIPIVGHKGRVAHRLVIKTQKPSSIILPEKLQKDY